ncbi:TonB-dependent receptor [Novosphingobium sp. Gsoil 351]|uniref:TonB-dependent receptor n=1 Tax=Novosphingobium sp. Gsoil 351 TaxID=2675225 RepID=UPI0012B47E0F|nr:TonB-dependent receptor [Novosphingobium sp. Gsoil 351]QGN53972.1 TonB-dependent receptor [Novosphingobium sp. Gsoil 351]
MTKSAIALLASISTLPLAAPALAQSSPPPADANTPDDDEATIVVTGLKRDQSFVEVPVAVQVFSEKTIERAGITRPEDFLALTPNVAFEKSNHAGEFFVNIRGQTSVRQSEGAVAIVIDGVQLATQNEFNGELFDIQQIEVLKGPQGALYGRNASAGAIVITTKEPTDELEGQVRASYGNWQSAKGSVSVGGPIVPGKLRFRLSAALSDTDGPFTNINTGEKVMRMTSKEGRARLIWDASEMTRFDLRGTASHVTGGAIAFNAQVVGSTQGGVPVTKIDTDDTSLPYTADVPGRNVQDKWSVALKIDHDFEWAKLTSVTSYNTIVDRYQAKNYPYGAWTFAGNEFVSDALSPGLNLDILAAFGDNTQKFRIANKAFIQEVRLTSPSEQRLRWQLGAYYLDSKRDFTTEQGLNGRLQRDAMGRLLPPFVIQGTTVGAPVAPVTRLLIGGGSILPTRGIDGPDSNNGTVNYDDNHYTARNIAPFGNIQFDITDAIEFQAAARYDIERRTIRTETPNIANPFFGVAPGAPAATYNLCVAYTGRTAAACREKRTFRQLQPKVTLTYKFPGKSGSIYAGYGRSFKSGGFNPIGTRAVLIQGLPNILVQDSYDKEVADSYELGFKALLLNRRISINGAVFHTTVSNAQQFEFFPTGGIQAISQIKKTRINGAEIDINARLTDVLSVFGGAGVIDGKIKDIDSQDPADRTAIIGNKIPFVPNYNISAGFQLTQPVSNTLNLLARVDYTRTGRIWYDQRNLANTDRSPIDIVNARLGVGNDRWDLALWSKNLFNERYNSDAVVILPVAHAVYRAPTRSYGLEGRFNF